MKVVWMLGGILFFALVLAGSFAPAAATPLLNDSYRNLRLPYAEGESRNVNRVASDCGTIPGHGAGRHAVDLGMVDEPIYAMHGGQVTFAGWTGAKDGGNVVVVDHGDDYCSLYYHLNEENPFAVETDDWVTQGQHIGTSGCTGNCTGEHLHIAVTQKVNGVCTRSQSREVGMVFDEHTSGELTCGADVVSKNHRELKPDENLIHNDTFKWSETQHWNFELGKIQHQRLNEVLYFHRPIGQANIGVIQDIRHPVPPNTPFEIQVDLGNTTPEETHVTVGLHNSEVGRGDIRCTFALPPNQPLQTYTLRGVANDTGEEWDHIRYEVWLEDAGRVDTLMDNVRVFYRPEQTTTQTQCLEPGATPLPPHEWLCESPDTYFCDVPSSHAFYTEIEALARAGLMNGCHTEVQESGGLHRWFCPDQSLARGDAMRVMGRWLYQYNPATSGDYSGVLPPPIGVFSDLTGDGEVARAVQLAHWDGLVNGFGDGTFRHLAPMSREHALRTIIKALLHHQPLELDGSVTFPDTSDPYVLKGAELGIASGYSAEGGDHIFRPHESVARGGFAKWMCRSFLPEACPVEDEADQTAIEVLQSEARIPRPDGAVCFTASGSAHIPGVNVLYDGMEVCYEFDRGLYRPTIQPSNDAEPPLITEPQFWHNGKDKTVIYATITDNVGVAWAEVVLTYYGAETTTRRVGLQRRDQTDQYFVELDRLAPERYTYFIEAGDLTGNQGRAPEEGSLEGLVIQEAAFGGKPSWMGATDDPVNTGVGNFYYHFADLRAPALGPDVLFERWYNAQSRYEGVLGRGWSWSYDLRLEEIENPLFQGVQVRYGDGHIANYVSAAGAFLSPPESRGDELRREGSEYLLTTQEHITYRFGGDGSLRGIQDQDGNTLALSYGNGRLTSIQDGSGRVVSLTYEGERLTEVRVPGYGTLRYVYEAGQLVGVTDTEGSQTTYLYDEEGRLRQILSPTGNPYLAEQRYDVRGRVVYQKDGTLFINEIAYDDERNQVTITDAAGRTYTHRYDPQQRLVEEVDGLGHSTRYTYDERNRTTSITDGNGRTTHFAYDTHSNLIAEVDALGNLTTYTYDDLHHLLGRTDALGHEWQYEYDARGHLVRQIDPLGGVIEHLYNEQGLRVATIDAEGHRTETAYNHLGLPTRITDALGNVSTMTYDSAGHLLSHTDAEGNMAAYQYNTLGLAVGLTDPEGYVTTYEYDADQNLVREANADGGVKTYTYDDNGRLVSETDWAGNSTTHEYDDLGRKLVEQDALGYTTRYEYDAAGNLARMTDKRGAVTTYTYDAAGNRLTETDALGQTTRYTYDALTRLVEVQRPCACPERIEVTVYDALGRAIEEYDALGNVTYHEYDAVGREVRREDALGFETHKQYDRNGNLIAETDAHGNVTRYEYDALNRVVTTVDRLDHSTLKEYDGSGRLIASTDANGHTTRFVYDGNNRLVTELDALAQGTHYTYDGRGNRLTRTDALDRVTAYSYDSNSNLTSETNPRGHTTTYSYDALNRRVEQVDALGGVTSYDYDPMGSLLAETDPRGHAQTTRYDLLGRPTSVTNRNGHTTAYEYDAAGNLVRTLDALGGETTLRYDANGNRLSATNALGYSTRYEYDRINRLARATDALAGVSTRGYDALGRLVSEMDANGHTTHHEYDAEGRLVATTDALGHTARYQYDAVGNLLQESDRNGNVTRYEYDGLNRQVMLVNALGGEAVTAYDAVGNVVMRVSFRGYETHFTHDASDNLLVITDALSGTTAVEYDPLDRQSRTTNANGHTTTYEYDAVGNLLALTLPEGQITRYIYDPQGNLLTLTNALGHPTHYSYDALDRQTVVRDPLGNLATTDYDAIGQKITGTDANGHATRYEYDALGRMVVVTDPLGHTTYYSYDAVGNRLVEQDANGHATRYEYDVLDRLVKEVNPIGSVWRYAYDPEGNLVQQMDARGQTIAYSFDVLHRLSAVQYPDSAQNVSYAYDPESNLIGMQNAVGQSEMSYDALNRLIQQRNPHDRVTRNRYDAVGNRLGLTYPGGNEVTYRYNGNNWLIEVADPRRGVTHYSYQADGQPVRVAFANQTSSERTYDEAGRLVQGVNRTATGGILTAYAHTLDPVGNRLQTIERYTQGQVRTNTKTYRYNARDEVTEAVEVYEGPPSRTVTIRYSYDAVGNRLQMESNRTAPPRRPTPPEVTTYTYDAANRLLTAGATTYSYDANGNRVGKLTLGQPASQSRLESYTYDAGNRLTRYTRQRVQTGQVEQQLFSTYDALGRRIERGTQQGQGTVKWTEYALDSLGYDPLAEYPRTGQPRITELYRGLDQELVSMNELQGSGGGSQYWFALDGLGSVAATTKQNGQSTHEYFYDPYGQVLDENGHWQDASSWTDPHNHYLLTGKEWDEESRLYYFGARFYDADAGRWLNADPYRGSTLPSSLHPYLHLGQGAPPSRDLTASPMQLHRYLYTRNNPLSRTDPLGFFDWNTGHVESGDTLWQIATDAGVTVEAILRWNPRIKDRNLIKVGDYLYLPERVRNAALAVQKKRAEVAQRSSPYSYNPTPSLEPTPVPQVVDGRIVSNWVVAVIREAEEVWESRPDRAAANWSDDRDAREDPANADPGESIGPYNLTPNTAVSAIRWAFNRDIHEEFGYQATPTYEQIVEDSLDVGRGANIVRSHLHQLRAEHLLLRFETWDEIEGSDQFVALLYSGYIGGATTAWQEATTPGTEARGRLGCNDDGTECEVVARHRPR